MNAQTPIPAPTPRAPIQNAQTYDARKLIAHGDTAQIVLGEQVYTLRITRAGKLILTK